MQASDKEKCEKLKFMAHIKEANPALKRSVNLLGGERPAIIGKKLTTAFTVGDGFLEIDMDVGSSNIASSLNGVVSRASKALVVDKCWLIEGQADDELPERVLCEFPLSVIVVQVNLTVQAPASGIIADWMT